MNDTVEETFTKYSVCFIILLDKFVVDGAGRPCWQRTQQWTIGVNITWNPVIKITAFSQKFLPAADNIRNSVILYSLPWPHLWRKGIPLSSLLSPLTSDRKMKIAYWQLCCSYTEEKLFRRNCMMKPLLMIVD